METSSAKTRPTLETGRLVLRPFELSDAPRVQLLAGDRAVAATTKNIPHPYEDGMAEQWIGAHQERFERGRGVVFAITRKDGGELIGAIGLTLNLAQESAELGYWIGKAYWGRGYCTEAGDAVLRYAFGELRLHRVHAHHFANNPASGRVMQKLGMRHEGRLRQQIKKWDEFFDVDAYGILRSDLAAPDHH
ncbi:MAG: GNAT family N-acetyltransferase [Verrucomicrobiia bacterium]